MTSDRIERVLERLQDDMAIVRESVARLDARMAAHESAASQLATLRDELSKHQQEDAGTQSELRAELRRLWWGCGVVFTAAVGQIAAFISSSLT
jgi:hypothetical protein